ncbi:TonB family protein [Fluviicola sp.]|uniref:TonB family protein n=1 Tax=Fluviicola sp. TaxID=1917219 RepID=UPI0031D93FE0
MKYLFTTLILSAAFCAVAQNKRDTIYFDSAWNVTQILDSAVYYRLIREEDHLYKVWDYYKHSDSIQMTGAFKDYAQKIREGEFVYYEKNGIKSYSSNYKNGKLHGVHTSYDDAGKLYATKNFADGELEGDFVIYDENGKIRRKETYVNGKRTFKACYLPNGKETTFYEHETPATFQKGRKSIVKYLKGHVRYPQVAVNNHIEGKVYLQFVVSDKGIVTDVKVKRSAHPLLDEEAVRVISNMPKWKPATFEGKKINSTFSLPVSFKLN